MSHLPTMAHNSASVLKRLAVLRGKNKYCITISVVDIKGKGRLSFPANFKSSYARHKVKGRMRKIPGCPMIIVKGYVVK